MEKPKENLKKLKERQEEVLQKTKHKTQKFFKEFRIQTATAIAAAFGFLIALAWRDAISDIVNKIIEKLGIASVAYLGKIIAAGIITILCIIGILLISRWGSKNKEKQKEEKK